MKKKPTLRDRVNQLTARCKAIDERVHGFWAEKNKLEEALSRDPKPTPVVEPLKAAAPEPPVDDEDPFWVKSAGKKIGLPMTVSFNMDEREELEKLLGVKSAEELLPKIRAMVSEYNTKAGLNALIASVNITQTRKRMGELLKDDPEMMQACIHDVENVILGRALRHPVKAQDDMERLARDILSVLFNIK